MARRTQLTDKLLHLLSPTISTSNLRGFSLDKELQAYSSLLSAVEKCYYTYFYLYGFFMRNMLSLKLFSTYRLYAVPLWLLSRFFSFVFSFQKFDLTVMYLHVDLSYVGFFSVS